MKGQEKKVMKKRVQSSARSIKADDATVGRDDRQQVSATQPSAADSAQMN